MSQIVLNVSADVPKLRINNPKKPNLDGHVGTVWVGGHLKKTFPPSQMNWFMETIFTSKDLVCCGGPVYGSFESGTVYTQKHTHGFRTWWGACGLHRSSGK